MLQGPRFLDQRQEATCLESEDTLLTNNSKTHTVLTRPQALLWVLCQLR